VEIEQVYPLSPQAAKRLPNDPCHIFSRHRVALGRDESPVGEWPDGLPEDFLGAAAAVILRRVEMADTRAPGVTDDADGDRSVRGATSHVAELPAAQAQAGGNR